MNQTTVPASTTNNLPYKLCEHIKDDGVQCGAPALSEERYCRFHIRTSDLVTPGDPGYVMPILETEQSVQIALQQFMTAVISGKLSERRAAVMLSGIKAAAQLIRQANANTPKQDLLNEIALEIRTRLSIPSKPPQSATELDSVPDEISTGN